MFKGGGGADLLVHPIVQGRCGVDVFWCSRRNIAFKAAGLISCDALGATYCSEGVEGLISCEYWRCNVVLKGVAGLIVLGCSKCDVVITGGWRGWSLVMLKMQDNVEKGVARLMSCNAENATHCSEGRGGADVLWRLPKETLKKPLKKLDDGWPESVEEQGLLLLVWRHHIRNNILKMCYMQSRRGVLRQK